MSKCNHCQSCLRTTWFGGNVYRYCTLCRVVYGISDGKLYEVTDAAITDAVRKMMGNVI